MFLRILLVFVFVLINTEVFSQSTDPNELLINDWHLGKYFI